MQFGSTDDPYIPVEQFRHIHEKLDTDYHGFENRGHFFESQDTFPEVLEVVKNKLEFKHLTQHS